MTAAAQFISLNESERWCVLEGDCLSILPTLSTADHVITDPPYDARTHAGARCDSGVPRGVQFLALESPAGLAPLLLSKAARWVLTFCTIEMIAAYRDGAGDSWVRAGIWDRVAPSPQLTGDRPAQACEGIAIMHRPGRKRWNRGGGAGIWRFVVERGAERPEHDTPKPVDLMLALVSDFTDPGDLVLDPFAGSGSTGVACLRLGRRFIGIERDPQYADLARERLRAEERGQSLQSYRAGQETLF